MASSQGVGRWTRYFAIASAISMVGLQVGQLLDGTLRVRAIIGLFGVVLPMIFGMGYLLLPAYAGETLKTPRLPGLQFAAVYLGSGLFLADALGVVDGPTATIGAGLWAFGVAIFVVALGYTIVPAIVANPAIVFRSENRPQRSTRLATAVIPVALGYLVLGTVILLGSETNGLGDVGVGFPTTVHFFAIGVGALLIFSLGIRLLTGFFHVAPPRSASWITLGAGGLAPLLLAPNLWIGPWFEFGAMLLVIAMGSYCTLVGYVASQTDYRRLGLYGILFGAIAGLAGVSIGALVALDLVAVTVHEGHVTLLLDGFLILTIVGYAYQFFPVTTGRFWGATERVALGTIVLIALGVGLEALGVLVTQAALLDGGTVLVGVGTAGYAYLLTRRLLGI